MIGTPQDRALVSLEGLALGDAFGESFFRPDALDLIRSRRVPEGLWRWTDDTAMAAAIVEALRAEGRIDQDDLARRFAERYRSEPGRGYSEATQRALNQIGAGGDWRAIAQGQFGGRGSLGNGAAMRAPVLGAWFADDLELVADQARRSAEVTHTHVEGIAGAIAVAVAAAIACRDDGPLGPRFIEAVLAHIPDSELKARAAASLDLHPEQPIDRVVAVLGNGSQITAHDTVPLALWCTSRHLTDYEQALWATVSALGDRDTTCAIVGGIITCRVGRDGLPAHWLDQREPLPIAISRS